MIEKEYAKAIFDLATEEKIENTVWDNFNLFNTLLEDKDLYNVLTSPFIKQNDKKEIIKKSLKGFKEIFINFLFVLVDNNRFDVFNGIFSEYDKLLLDSKNVVLIEVKSAAKLTEAQLFDIKETLKDRYDGKQMKFENIIDPKLIGGFELSCDGQVIDATVKSKLNKLKASL